MEDSVLYKYFLDSRFLSIDESEIKTCFTEDMKKHKENLENILTKEQMKDVDHYKYSIVGHMFHVRDEECQKMFYLGIKLGMEVANFLNEENGE